jgi:hypothetical protein
MQAAATSTAQAQTTSTAYAAKVQAALSRNPSGSVSQMMAALGVPQSQQQQVADLVNVKKAAG